VSPEDEHIQTNHFPIINNSVCSLTASLRPPARNLSLPDLSQSDAFTKLVFGRQKPVVETAKLSDPRSHDATTKQSKQTKQNCHFILNHRKNQKMTKSVATQDSSAPKRTLYPPIEPYDSGRLKVSDIHELYYEQCGNPNGKPAIVVHGGPGGGCVASYRQYFDPVVYRIVMFDQRGAGRSTPHAELEENTTWHLVEDMETIRKHLGIENWTVVFGGSWGSTLSLAYAQTHPERVKSLVLRGIFTLRRRELEFFYQEGSSWVFPDAWDQYLEPIPEEERGDLMAAYYKRLTGDNEEEKLRCARAWSVWEMSTSRLFVDPAYIARAAEDDLFAVAFARIECHYFVNAGWFKDGQLIDNAGILKDIPVEIVQGRYDMVCPAKSAWDLHKNLAQSNLVIVPDAGHSAIEPGIVSALVEACDKFRDL